MCTARDECGSLCLSSNLSWLTLGAQWPCTRRRGTNLLFPRSETGLDPARSLPISLTLTWHTCASERERTRWKESAPGPSAAELTLALFLELLAGRPQTPNNIDYCQELDVMRKPRGKWGGGGILDPFVIPPGQGEAGTRGKGLDVPQHDTEVDVLRKHGDEWRVAIYIHT